MTCTNSSNNQGKEAICLDSVNTAYFDSGSIACQTEEGARLNVEPEQLTLGETFTIRGRRGRPLSSKANCTIAGDNGSKIQQLVIDTSGDAPLNLDDVFGSVRLEACVREDEEISCLRTTMYDIAIENTGTVNIDIISANFTYTNATDNLIEDIDTTLGPGQSTELEIETEVNVCNSATVVASIGTSQHKWDDLSRCQRIYVRHFSVNHRVSDPIQNH
jgi:hypothetical protein